MNKRIYIQGARVLDPVTGRDEARDLYLEDGRLAEVPESLPADVEFVRASGLMAAPAFCDLHVHFRQPGGEDAETVASGCRAAAAGGFGSVVPMPNTKPPIDTPELVRWEIEEARRAGQVAVYPSACITRGRAGRELTDMAALAAAGAVFFTDDGSTVMDDAIMLEAMRTAAGLGMPIVDHAQRGVGGDRGVMHAGACSAKLGLPGIPSEAETEIVERDIKLAEQTGCALHVQHLSAAGSIDLIRSAKERGVKVTAEVTPHHLALCDEDVLADDANLKMNPPLRSPADREALRMGICDGVIDCFATDHAPHPAESKARGFREAPFGVIGLETAAGVTYTELVATGEMEVMDWLRCWTTKPMSILGKRMPELVQGQKISIALWDPDMNWKVDSGGFLSSSENSCFSGRELTCKLVKIIL